MIHIDHIAITAVDLYEASDRLRRESRLGFYDGGWFPSGGSANKIFPIGGPNYIEVGSTTNPAKRKPGNPMADYMNKALASGEDAFTGLCLGVDSMEELQDLAKRHKSIIPDPHLGTRVRSSGMQFLAYQTPPAQECWPKGLPNWYYFTDMTLHPSGQPTEPFPGLHRPTGIKYLEMGGTEKEMTEWLGVPASTMPFKFNGKAKGIYSVAINTEDGEVVTITRNNAYTFSA
jgi:hypothetical protein